VKNIDKLKLIFEKGAGFMIPPPVLFPSEWAEQNLILTDGPNAGQKMRLFSFPFSVHLNPLVLLDLLYVRLDGIQYD